MIVIPYDKEIWPKMLCQAADLTVWQKILQSGYVLCPELRRSYAANPPQFQPPLTKWTLWSSSPGETTFSNIQDAYAFLMHGRFNMEEAVIYGLSPPSELPLEEITYTDTDEIGNCRVGVNCLAASQLRAVSVGKVNLEKFLSISQARSTNLLSSLQVHRMGRD